MSELSDSELSDSELSDEALEDFKSKSDNKVLQPYSFEPCIHLDDFDSNDEEQRESNDENSSGDNQEHDRLHNTNWCTCGSCTRMDTARECICCQEVVKVWDMCQSLQTEGLPVATCITQHPGFLPVCTNKYVLKTAWMQYKQQYSNAYDGPEHKQFRHIAYRQMARWCWGFLGKEMRVVLPSCTVMCIRAHFPPPGLEENFQFQGFCYGDE